MVAWYLFGLWHILFHTGIPSNQVCHFLSNIAPSFLALTQNTKTRAAYLTSQNNQYSAETPLLVRTNRKVSLSQPETNAHTFLVRIQNKQ